MTRNYRIEFSRNDQKTHQDRLFKESGKTQKKCDEKATKEFERICHVQIHIGRHTGLVMTLVRIDAPPVKEKTTCVATKFPES